jgi:uncharacterized protein (DUF697 family)
MADTHLHADQHPPKTVVVTTDDSRLHAARKIVTNNSRWAAGLGLIPLPLVDWAAISGIQTRMLHQLCHEYRVEYDKARASRYVGALIGGFVPTSVGYSLASALKAVPIIGTASFVAIPILAYATTYALGEVFIPHFESGGNLYSFDPDAHREFFRYYYLRGKAAAEAHA